MTYDPESIEWWELEGTPPPTHDLSLESDETEPETDGFLQVEDQEGDPEPDV